MKVILTEKVPTLGNVGEIVNVSSGYGRNFLIPGRMAVLADESNKAQANHMEKLLAKKVAAQKGEAETVKGKIDGLALDLIKKVGSNGRLFGTVTTQELSKELASKGIEIERRALVLEQPIKALGTYTVKAKIFKGVEAEFSVKVSIDPKQAEEMKKKAEADAKRKEEKLAADALKAEAGEGEEGKEDVVVEMTDEQRLAKEAADLLRS